MYKHVTLRKWAIVDDKDKDWDGTKESSDKNKRTNYYGYIKKQSIHQYATQSDSTWQQALLLFQSKVNLKYDAWLKDKFGVIIGNNMQDFNIQGKKTNSIDNIPYFLDY